MRRKNYTVRMVAWIGVVLGLCSCTFPNGVSIGPVNDNGEKTITMKFSKVSLKFDLSKKFNTDFISGEYSELICAHNLMYNSGFSGTITSLNDIIWLEDNYDETHKPSITVTIEDPFGSTTKYACTKNDVVGNTVFGIPNIQDFKQATIEIKSVKTITYGIQIVWKKSAVKDNWPINEFVADGTISYSNEFPSILKAGTNNGNGNVAVRNNTVISNTSDGKVSPKSRFVVEERQVVSPDLCKPVAVGGTVSNAAKWSKPTICKKVEVSSKFD